MINSTCFRKSKLKRRATLHHNPSRRTIIIPSRTHSSIPSADSFNFCPSTLVASEDDIKPKKPSQWDALQNTLKKKAGPPWYRELSPTQMKSADGLQDSLRDDMEHHTTTKTRALAAIIGLSPLPNNKNLSLAMDMSRGNDLAFLWFLNESVYNTKGLQEDRMDYNENEKLILSSIAHLDMVTTLRELDRILPKPQNVTFPHEMGKPCAKKIIYTSPYLEPLTRPKLPKSKLFLPPIKPNSPVNPYMAYKDKSFTPANEKTRWYAKMQRKQSDMDREALLKKVCSGSATGFEQRKNQIFNQFLESTKCQRNKRTRVVYQVDLNNANTTEEFEDLAKQYQKQTIVKTILRDLMENAMNVQKMQACCKTIECMMDYEKYLCVLEKNLEQQKQERDQIKYFDINECKFDYDKIFNDETFDQNQSKSGYLAGEMDKRMTKSTEICMKNLFCLEIPLWSEPPSGDNDSCSDDYESYKDGDKNEDLESGYSSKSNSGAEIDPDDPQEVQNELDAALKRMKKNPKFVLASIPLAAEIPLLAEFAFQRFGRTISDEERLKLFKKRDKQYGLLIKAKMKFTPPKGDAINGGSLDPVTWDKRNWLVRRTNEVRDDYYRRVNLHFLEQTRMFWPILQPHLCTDGLPREVFFAYMPASEKDIKPFRPWQNKIN